MPNPKVKILRSSVSGKRPGVDNIELGELALNTNDGQLFAKRDTGGVGIATTVTLLTPWQEVYEGGTIEYSGNATVTGILSATTIQGNASTLSGIVTQITAGPNISIDQATGNVTITGLANTANVIADTLVVSGIATVGVLSATDGVVSGTLTATSFVGPLTGNADTATTLQSNSSVNTSGIITASAFFGDGSGLDGVTVGVQTEGGRVGTGFTDFKFIGAGVSSVVGSGSTVTINIPADTIITRQVATASGITTDFTITGGYTVGFIDVYLNGVKQRSGTDFTATDESTVSMSPYVNDGDVLEFQIYKNLSMGAIYDGTEGQLLQHNGTTYVGIASTGYKDYVIDEGQGYYAYTTDYYTVGVANTTQEIVAGEWTLVQPQVASGGLYNHQPGPMLRCNAGDPWVGSGATIGTGQTEFSLAGTEPGTSCLVRTVIRFEPDTDETDLDMRLHFTTNTATQGTGLTNFNLEKQALVMTTGAGVTYSSETLISFFVGDTLYGDTKADAGRFCIQVNGTTDGTLEVLGVTVMADI